MTSTKSTFVFGADNFCVVRKYPLNRYRLGGFSYICVMKNKGTKKITEKIEYFTDEMHKNIFPFQEKYTLGKGKAVIKPVKLTMKKNN